MEATARWSSLPAETTRPAAKARAWHRVALVGVLLLALFLNFYHLEQEGYGNLYYAAAVKSMLTSWHNFFFVSFDPGGFVTVDKPPLGLWVQAASAALFGFNGLSLILPQALAGVLSVALLYHLVRRTFGPTAGLLAALVLALTPISVAANRNNTMDSQLVLVLLLAAWAILRAVETGRLRWLLACAVLVGLGFNIKMLQAYMVLPAFYLLYLLASPLRWWKRLLHLALATAVLLTISLAWAVAVDLTPPDQRPYVGSSQSNSVLELIIGHNGLSRLLPGGLRALTGADGNAPDGRPPGPPPLAGGGQVGAGPVLAPGRTQSPPPPGGAMPTARSGGHPFADEIGIPSPLRLFNRQLAGQASWLLPLAGLGFLAAAWQTRPRLPLDRRHQSLLLWAGWLLPMVIFFSVANLFHRYYLEMLAPAIAALVGAGVVAMWKDYRRPGWRGWLLPVALMVGAVAEALILVPFPAWSQWLTPLVVGLSLGAAAALAVGRLARRSPWPAWATVAAAVGVLVLLIPPAVWALTPIRYGGATNLPYAGPDLTQERHRNDLPDVERLVAYLAANRGEATYLAATVNANTAAPFILATGEPMMAMGGFSGGDPILTAEELAERVAEGEVRFFLVPTQENRQGELVRWVVEQCHPIPDRVWRSAPMSPGRGVRLFDCG